jgi:hypothetical protein
MLGEVMSQQLDPLAPTRCVLIHQEDRKRTLQVSPDVHDLLVFCQQARSDAAIMAWLLGTVAGKHVSHYERTKAAGVIGQLKGLGLLVTTRGEESDETSEGAGSLDPEVGAGAN